MRWDGIDTRETARLSVVLPMSFLEDIKDLISDGHFKNRSEGICRIVKEYLSRWRANKTNILIGRKNINFALPMDLYEEVVEAMESKDFESKADVIRSALRELLPRELVFCGRVKRELAKPIKKEPDYLERNNIKVIRRLEY